MIKPPRAGLRGHCDGSVLERYGMSLSRLCVSRRVVATSSAAAVILATHLALALPVLAQAVTGSVVKGGTGSALSDVTVGLHTSGGITVDEAQSDSLGRFELQAPGAGSYFLTASKQGFADLTHGDFYLGENDRPTLEIFLRPAPIELEGIDVSAEGIPPVERLGRLRLQASGFLERKAAGFGDFFTPEMIEERQPINFTDIVERLPRVAVDGGILVFTRFGMPCEPNIWINGVLALGDRVGGSDELRAIDDRVLVGEVLGVEVYRSRVSTPMQYAGPGSDCGTVLIWTK